MVKMYMCEGRRIAFIIYLVSEDWDTLDGGALDLFSHHPSSPLIPSAVATSLVPQWNSFAFFPTTPSSFHQVSEILTDKIRLSISGWFYGKYASRNLLLLLLLLFILSADIGLGRRCLHPRLRQQQR